MSVFEIDTSLTCSFFWSGRAYALVTTERDVLYRSYSHLHIHAIPIYRPQSANSAGNKLCHAFGVPFQYRLRLIASPCNRCCYRHIRSQEANVRSHHLFCLRHMRPCDGTRRRRFCRSREGLEIYDMGTDVVGWLHLHYSLLFLPRNLFLQILYRRAVRLRKATGDEWLKLMSEIKGENMSGREIATIIVLIRPFTLNFQELIVLLLNLYIYSFSVSHFSACWAGFLSRFRHSSIMSITSRRICLTRRVNQTGEAYDCRHIWFILYPGLFARVRLDFSTQHVLDCTNPGFGAFSCCWDPRLCEFYFVNEC